MRIEINNQQQSLSLRAGKIKSLASQLMAAAAKIAPDRQWGEVVVVLVDNAGITQINATHLNKPETTDVISFCYDPLPGETDLAADIVVNVDRAVEEGSRRNGGASRELALYIAHGCDHLTGADDGTPEDRKRMRRRELRWLTEADSCGLLEGILLSDSAAVQESAAETGTREDREPSC